MSRRTATVAESSGLYPTPRWPVPLLLDALLPQGLPRGGHWIEPCAGDESIICAVEEHLGPDPGRHWTAIELDEPLASAAAERTTAPRKDVICGDARFALPELAGDVSITNAPFPLAVQIAEAMLRAARWVGLVQRLDWMECAGRRSFWTGPGAGMSLYVLPDRPKYRPKGQDSGGYAWYVWHPDRIARPPVWLPTVPLVRRQEHRHQLRLVVEPRRDACNG